MTSFLPPGSDAPAPAAPEAAPAADPRVTKRRVTMRSVTLSADGEPLFSGATDYVRPDFLDAYVADAKTRWQSVEVSDEPDAGPGGYDGPTFIPGHLDHPLAGQFFAATDTPQAV